MNVSRVNHGWSCWLGKHSRMFVTLASQCAGWSGTIVIVAHNGVFDIMPTGGAVFGMSVPAQQIVQQIAAAIGQDPSNINPGFVIDRLFTCKGVMIVDGRTR